MTATAPPSIQFRSASGTAMTELSIERRTSQGHTLVELLLATALASVAIGTCVTVFDAARLHGERAIDDARIRMAGRAALDFLKSYGRLAGYGRHLCTSQAQARSLPIMACGRNASMRFRARCADFAPRTDAFAVSYRADRASAWSTVDRMPSDCEGHAVRQGGAKQMEQIAAQFIVREDRKHPGQRQLHCSRRHGYAGEPLVENIDHLRLRYWVSGVRQPRTADAMADTEWPRVIGFDACVIVRGERRGGAEPYRDCDNRQQAAARDGYRRQVFTATVAIRNAHVPDDGTHDQPW